MFMNNNRFVFLIFSAIVLSTSVNAACPGSTQSEMTECASIEFKKADKELNELYKKLDKSAELLASQRAWLAFRDAECKFQVSPVKGGSMEPMVYMSCLETLTKDRVKQLDQDISQ